MRHRGSSRFLVMTLVVALLIQMLPIQAFANQEQKSETAEQVNSSMPTMIVEEEIALRGETEKHFRLSDGSYLAVMYGMPVHYQDTDGSWQDIDNSPLMITNADNSTSYQISNADKFTCFSSELTNGTIFSTSVGKYSVSMQMLDSAQLTEERNSGQRDVGSAEDMNLSTSEEVLQIFSSSAVAQIEESVDLAVNDHGQRGWQMTDLTPEKLRSSVIYENVFQGVDLRYETQGYNIKEEIIIRNPQNNYQYDFLLKLEGLTAAMNSQGIIALVDKNGTVIYEIPAPYMFDGEGEYSEAVTYSLRTVKDGAILSISADESWINDANRKFPVVIDPTLNLIVNSNNNSEDANMYITFVEENEPEQTAQGANPIYVGYGIETHELRGYIYVNTLPDLPAGTFVTQAVLELYQNGYSHSSLPEMPLGIYEVDSASKPADQSYRDWIRYMTWNTKPAYDASNLIDYAITSSSTVYNNVNGYSPVSWDMTELVKKWYHENTQNRTIALGVTTEYTSSRCAVCTFKSYGSSYAPTLAVTYRSSAGVEPYYTYNTMGGGLAGTAYISDASGQLKIAKNLINYSSTSNPFSLNLVYNSDYFVFSNSQDYQPIQQLDIDMSVGSGWTLDCIQRIEEDRIAGTKYLKYYDGDGTVHYFAKDKSRDSSETYYFDEDGLGLRLVKLEVGQYVMYDYNGNRWTFNESYLFDIEDSDGNKTRVNYRNDKISTIEQRNSNKSNATLATFTYTGDLLTGITDAAGRSYVFTYDGTKLVSITLGGELIAQYEYGDSNNPYRLTQAKDCHTGYSLCFEYAAGKVSSIYEKSGSVTGAKMGIEYPSYSQTVYHDYGLDRQQSTGDDLFTSYLFDYSGRTINAYTTDKNGKILGATNAVYSDASGTDAHNNRMVRTGSIGIAGQQLLVDSSFEEGSANWVLSSASRNSESKRTGNYGIKGVSTVAETMYTMNNSVSLNTGSVYTFSAYVNTSNVTNITGLGLFLKVAQGDNQWESDPLNYSTSEDIDGGWTRLSVTFTAVQNGNCNLAVCAEEIEGTVWMDDFQLEKGEAPSSYNLLQNGTMESSGYWTMGTSAQFGSTAAVAGTAGTTNAIRITSGPQSTQNNATQTVNVNLSSSQTYIVSGWAKANAVPDNVNTASDPAQDAVKQFGLRIILNYSDNTKEYHYVPFNADLSPWQFVSYTLVPNPKDSNGNPVEKTVASISVVCAYEGNANVAYFDNISLLRESAQTMKYDDKGNLVSVTSTGLSTATDTYDDGDLIRSVTGGQGTYDYTYDSEHHMLTASNSLITQSMSYDTVGNTTSTTLRKAGEKNGLYMQTTAAYDSTGNLLTSVTDASGSTVTYAYETALSVFQGQPTKVTAPNGTVTQNALDIYDRVISTSVANAVVQYQYQNGRLGSISRTHQVNGQNKTQSYSFGYDPFGNTTSIGVGTRQLATYTYAGNNGLLQKQTYGNGHELSYTYDTLGRMKTSTWNNGRTLTYAYTGDGQVYSITESGVTNPAKYLYHYDSIGRLVSSEKRVNGSLVLRTHQQYNEHNQLVGQSWQLGSDAYSESYTYNAADGSLNTITAASGQTLTYGYDDLRRLTTVDTALYEKSYAYRNLGNGRTTGQVSSVTYDLPTDQSFGYGYDSMGNIATYTDVNGTVTYTYDAQGQLTQAVRGSTSWTYSYDNAGNILSGNGHTYTYGDNTWTDLLTAVDGHTISYDAAGNPTGYYNGTQWSFGWTEGRRLSSASGGGHSITYTYDADGLRTGKTVDGTAHSYYYAGGKLLRETYGTTTLDFFYDGSGMPYVLKYNGTVYYYITNLQGDVISIVDGSGAVVASYSYDPYGNVLTATGTLAETNPLRYRGYYYDSETRLYYLQSRYYDPELGRFLSHDVIFDTDAGLQGFNLFAYCGNNPICRTDVSGTDSDKNEDLDLVDDEMYTLGGGISIASGCGPSTWELFVQSLKDAASGLAMATGHNSFSGSERHHIFSDKNKTYTPQYKEIANRYNYSLSQQENIVELEGHHGRHTNAYHEYMLQSIKALDIYANGDSVEFLRGIAAIAELLRENKWLPYAR